MPGTWNFRAMPRRLIACGARPVMSSPRKRTVPAVGENAPVMMLNSVVLPQPLGPMMQRSSPAPMDRFTPRSTWRPPNCLETPQTSRSGGVTERRRTPSPLALALRLDEAQVLEQYLPLVLRLGDDDVEIGVTVFRTQPHHPVAGLEPEAGHGVDDLLPVHRAGPLDALDEEAGQHVVGVHRVAHDGVFPEALLDLGHERLGLRLVQGADEVGDGDDGLGLVPRQAGDVVLAVAEPRELGFRLAARRHELLDEGDGVRPHHVEHQHLGTRLLDLAHRAGEVLHAERGVLLAHDPAAGLLGRLAHRLVHLARPHLVAAEHVEAVAVALLEERDERAHPLLRQPAVADDIAAAHAALVVGRVKERGLEALDGGSDGVAVGAGDGAEDGDDLVTLDQLAGALDRGLRIGLVVGDDQLEPPPAHPARLVGLLDRQACALHALLAEVLEAARQRLQHADLDRIGRTRAGGAAESQRSGAGGALRQGASGRGSRSSMTWAPQLPSRQCDVRLRNSRSWRTFRRCVSTTNRTGLPAWRPASMTFFWGGIRRS